jgi:hypothetical protein
MGRGVTCRLRQCQLERDIHHYYVIVLTAGAYYSTSTNCSTGGYLSTLARVITGHICVPANSNPSGKWLYTVSSNLPSLPALGSLVHPATDAAKMPKIVTNDSGDGIVFEGGANHIWVAGVGVFSAATNGSG